MSSQQNNYVLIVDDDPMFRLMLDRFLCREGFAVLQAESGEEALQSFAAQPALIVLMDANMPGMSGFSCCEQLRLLPGGEDVAVLMLTALDDESFVDRAFSAGAMDYLTKPVHWAVLRNRLHYISQIRRAQNAQRASDVRKSAILNSALDCILTVDACGGIQEFNPSACRTFGYSLEEVTHGCGIGTLVPELGVLNRGAALPETILNTLRETTALRNDGSTFPVEMSISWSEIDEGGFYTLILRDIAARKRAEQDLELAATVLANTVEAVMITDTQNRIQSVNPAFTEITGFSEEEVVGQTPAVLSSGRHDRGFYKALWQSLQQQGRWQGEIWNRRKDGSTFPEWLSINSVLDSKSGEVSCYIGLFSDISTRKAYEENIWRQANFDTLTQLPNRNHFKTRLSESVKTAQSKCEPMALMFIDLDRFKEINDTLGHSQGDRLLVEAARRLRNCVREADLVARLGGDEFTAILPGLSAGSGVVDVGQRILAAMAEPFELISGEPSFISASIGITIYPEDAEEVDTLLSYADMAMYRSKEQGRNQLTLFQSEMAENLRRRVRMEGEKWQPGQVLFPAVSDRACQQE